MNKKAVGMVVGSVVVLSAFAACGVAVFRLAREASRHEESIRRTDAAIVGELASRVAGSNAAMAAEEAEKMRSEAFLERIAQQRHAMDMEANQRVAMQKQANEITNRVEITIKRELARIEGEINRANSNAHRLSTKWIGPVRAASGIERIGGSVGGSSRVSPVIDNRLSPEYREARLAVEKAIQSRSVMLAEADRIRSAHPTNQIGMLKLLRTGAAGPTDYR